MSLYKIQVFLVWMLSVIAFLIITTMPINLQTQLICSLVVFALMAILKLLKKNGSLRIISLAFGLSIIARYVYWRTTETIPSPSQIENFIPGLLLYIAEMYNVLTLLLSLFVVSRPLPSRPSCELPHPNRLPCVDVFVPSYNEPADILGNTLAAAKAMDYPAGKVTVWLLDDGGTLEKRNSSDILKANEAKKRHEELQKLCADLDVIYLTRERNEHAKAGNLNYGLEHSKGDLIAIFDADHAPAREFLTETVGHFAKDPKLFLVQTPHFFINPDPLERNLKTFEFMPSENEMFYGIIQRGLDKWNASFFCGSAAVLRREALEETGGFSGKTITEDCESALSLHAKGWNSVYVDKPLIAGLQPATFASFIGQRSRWAQGMVQLMRYNFPLFKSGLSLPQRLCYLSSMMFWFFPISRTIFLFAPFCYIFFDLKIFEASGGDFMAYTLAYMLVNLMMQNYLYGSFRWPWISELYEYSQTIHLLPAVLSAIANPSKPSFNVTAKDESIKSNRLSEINRPFFVVFFALLLAVAFSIYKIYAEPYKADVTLVVGGWNIFNLILAGCALGVVSERGERQNARRITVSRTCEFYYGDSWHECSIDNVSIHGTALHIYEPGFPEIGRDAIGKIRFTKHDGKDIATLNVAIRNIRQSRDRLILGCVYQPESPRDYSTIADLVFANSRQWSDFMQGRRHNPGIVRGTLWFLALSVRQTLRGFEYLIKGSIKKSKEDDIGDSEVRRSA